MESTKQEQLIALEFIQGELDLNKNMIIRDEFDEDALECSGAHFQDQDALNDFLQQRYHEYVEREDIIWSVVQKMVGID